jgi:signal transduction histidine kinase
MTTSAFQGTTRSDVGVVVVLASFGVYLMVENITAGADADLRIDSHSWWLLPVWLAAVLPLLWWRRNPAVTALVVTAVMVVHVLAFGWVARCGCGLPLAWTLAFLVGTRDGLRRSAASWTITALLAVVVLVRDSAAGLGLLPFVLVISLAIWGLGRVAHRRAAMVEELRSRNAELAVLRDRRADLEVHDDRARMSAELDLLLRDRLGQLSRAASAGARGRDAEGSRALMAGIEAESRQTLADMREIVGTLRGGDVNLAPVPSVAHLDALLARSGRSDATLEVSGEARALPASVELSVYRIVEHLLGVLGGGGSPVEVHVRFEDDALEIRMSGPVHRGADLRAAVARARERAQLQDGSLDVKIARGRASAVAQVPIVAV